MEHFSGEKSIMYKSLERQRFDVNMEPFTLTPGPTINLRDSGKAVDFQLFFSEEIFLKIVELTNKNARKLKSKHQIGNLSHLKS